MKKRFLSLFLVLVLCLSLLPASAFAAEPNVTESGAGAANEEKENETIVPEGSMSDNSGIGSGSGSTGGLLVEDGNTQPGGGLVVPAEQNGSGSAEAKIGDTEYDTLADALFEMSEDEIILLTDVTATEELSVDVSTTINMDGHSITGNIAVNDSLTLKNGTVTGKVTVTVDATEGTFTMTAPADAAAAIDGGLEVNSGSCSVSGAQIGVKGTLYFDGTSMSISGSDKAVELTAAAGPVSKKLYGSAMETGDTSTEAVFEVDTYKVGGETAKKLSSTKTGSTEEPKPEAKLTLDRETADATAGETVTFTATYTGTDALKAYIQGNALTVDDYFKVGLAKNEDGTYTISVKIDAETPTGKYTLYVQEVNDSFVQAKATINVTGKEPVAEVIRAGESVGTYTSLPTALDKAQDGDTIKLLANHVTDTDALKKLGEDFTFEQYASIVPVVTKTLTLDLNHKTVDYLEVGFTETNEKTQKKETLATGNLTVTSEAAYGRISNLLFMAGALDIRGGEIGDSHKGGLTCDANSGSVTVSNGTVYGLTVLEGASVTVNGGSKHAGEWVVASGATLNITDGTFGEVQFTHNGTIAISGGTFKSIKSYIAEELQPLMSLLADGYAFYGKDADEKYTVLQDSRETTLENVKVMDHTDHAFLNGACIACGALTCDKSNNGEEGGCIAHAVWSPWADNPTWGTTHIKTLDELRKKITDGGTNWSEMNPDTANATVTFLSDVTVDKTFLIDQYFAQIFLDLNGHTLSGELQEPIITANFSAGNPIIAIRNGTIENTGTGEAIRLERGRVTLENVNVTGDMAIAYQYVNGSMYTAPFLGGGSFTRICPAANDVGGTWSKELKDMLGTGCCFLDSAGSRIDAEQWFGSAGYSKIKELIDVRVKACDHKDENGSYTLFEDATMSYGSLAKRCKICGNLCPHDEITGDQNPACVACGLPIVIKTTNLLGGKDIGPWYYTGLNDAMHEILHVNKGRRPTLELLADTKSDSSYEWLTNDYDGIFIDLAGHTLTLTGDKNKASYWVTIQNTSDTHAEVRGTVNVYHKDNRSKLVILDTDNDLTIEEVKFVGDGTAQFAGGSFGKITVPAGKTLASLLVSGYYFADSNSATDKPAALYDTAGKALTVLTKVTVKPCSHDEAIYVPVDGGAWKCFCGQKTFVASVTKDDTTTLYTDLQEAFKAADGGTVELMANMVDVTVNTEKPFIFDLNGHSIHKLTVNSKITLKDSSEGEGKIVENLIVEAEGLTVGDLLEEGYAFRSCSDNSWYGETLKTVGNARVQQVPITSVTLDALNAKDNTDAPTTMVYGTTGGVKLSASCNILNLTTPDCKWYEVSGSLIPIDNAMGMNYFLPDDLIAGEHTYLLICTSDGYSKSAEITITVTKIDIANVPEDQIELELAYGGNVPYNINGATNADGVHATTMALSPVEPFKVNGIELTEKDYTLEGDVQYGVGEYTLKINVDTAIYTGSIERTWHVIPRKLGLPGFLAGEYEKTYDGETALPKGITYCNGYFEPAGKDYFLSPTNLKPSDYTLTNEAFENATVGKDKRISLTLQLLNKNYEFNTSYIKGLAKDGITVTADAITYTNCIMPPTVHFNITPATMPDFNKEVTLDIVNDLENTYTIDLPALPALESPKTYGDITYTVASQSLEHGYATLGQPTVKQVDGKYQLCLTVPAVKYDQETSIGTILVKVTTTNYNDVVLTVNLQSVNKRILGMFVSVATDPVVYGMTLGDIKLSADATVDNQVIPGTIAWDDPLTTVPAAGQATYRWTFTPDDTMHYLTASNTITFLVDKATPTGAPIYAAITTGGKTLADAALTANAGWPSGTVQWVDKDGKPLPAATQVQANTEYTWSFTPADADNYNGATGSVTLYAVTSGGGGGGGSSSTTTKTDTATNPDGSVTKTETKSDGTVVETTIGKDGSTTKTETKKDGSSVTENKAADGSTGTVKTDKNGQTTAETALSSKAIETAKRNGESVTAPIEVEATRNSDTAPTVKIELPRNSGDTKVEIPVTNVKPGTVAVLVHPDGTEEIVKNSLPTEDGIQLTVNGGATVKIVDNSKDFIDTRNHWAKDAIDFVSARGLVSGMSGTTYAPDASTTRAQLWTILARQSDADLSGGANWYEKAQLWSKDKGISDGTNPNAAINRAQMVTMLWRTMGQPAAGGTANFTDVPASSYYAQAVAWAVENGITTGVGGGRFDPNSACTRGQIATFLYRLYLSR